MRSPFLYVAWSIVAIMFSVVQVTIAAAFDEVFFPAVPAFFTAIYCIFTAIQAAIHADYWFREERHKK